MDYQPSHESDYGGVERAVLPQNSENGHFIDTGPTRRWCFSVKDATQARKIFAAYRRHYHEESLQHVLMHVLVRGNRLYLSAEGASRLEEFARMANVPIKVKKIDIIRK